MLEGDELWLLHLQKLPVCIVRKVVSRSHPMECQHASRKSDTIQLVKIHRYDLRLGLLRVLGKLERTRPLLCRSRGCGLGVVKEQVDG